MRPSWHNWLLRSIALLIFISGGALARAIVQDFETHIFAAPVRESPKQDLKAIALEVRQPAPVQLEGAVAAVLFVGLLRLVLPTFLVRRQERPALQVTRAFDALAPPAPC